MKLGISTAFIAVFFFVIRCLEQNFRYWLPFLVGALVTNGIWNYFCISGNTAITCPSVDI